MYRIPPHRQVCLVLYIEAYIATQEVTLYLVSLEDAFSRKIVGWALDNNIEAVLCRR